MKPTIGELIVGGLTFLTIAPTPANWSLAPVVGLAAVAAYKARRHPAVQAWAEEQLEQLPSSAAALVRYIPVPPAGVPRLPAPVQRTLVARPEPTEGVLGAGGLLSLLGESPAKPKSTNVGTPPSPQPVVVKAADPDAEYVKKATGPRKAATPQPKVLPLRELLRRLNEEVDERPHIFIAGNTGSGKTVLAQLVLATRPGYVVILDPKRPKGYEAPKWGGLPYVSRDRESASYQPMVAALTEVVAEMDRRYAAQEDAKEPFPQLTVVLDEAKNSVEECEQLAQLYRRIVSIGREVNIRLVLLSTTDRAGKLGFSGEADSMDSLTWVRLGQFALNVSPDSKALGENRWQWAVVDEASNWLHFDNSKTLSLVKDLNGSRSKPWQSVKYNCQTGTTGQHPVVRSTAAQPVVTPLAGARAQVVAQPVATGDDLLQQLLRASSVSRAEGGRPSREGAEERKVIPSDSDAPSRPTEPTREDLSNYLSVLKNLSTEDKRKVGLAWKLYTIEGLDWSVAVRQGFGCTYGRAYQRGSNLLKMLKTVNSYGLLRE